MFSAHGGCVTASFSHFSPCVRFLSSRKAFLSKPVVGAPNRQILTESLGTNRSQIGVSLREIVRFEQ